MIGFFIVRVREVQHFYFDHNAASPLAPEVLRELGSALAEVYGNASSIHHFGQRAKQKLEASRRAVAAAIGCDAPEIVFTSGGTESDNLAILGVLRRKAGLRHVITTAIEHPAVLNTCDALSREGVAVTRLRPNSDCQIDPDDLRKAIRSETALISIMHANNETGILQPIEDCAALARGAGIPFHSDAVQTAGRVPVDARALGVDLLSIGGHKFGAPKGIGALYVRKGMEVAPIVHGGHHERDRRAGTENVPGAIALGYAVSGEWDWNSLAPLRDRLESGILARVPAARVNGSTVHRLPNTTNIRFDGIEGEAMVIALDLRGFATSSGSACSSGAVEPSHVLLAMGLSPAEARSSVRFSLGPENTVEQVDKLIDAVSASVAHLRRISTSVVAHA
jgi:cysteine desulfurase